jgi:periplasmic protein CpxP/Spy
MLKVRAAALGVALLAGFAGLAGAQSQGTQVPGTKAPRAEARGPWQGRGMRGRAGFGSFVKDLKLTDAQKAQIKAIHEKYRPQLEAVRKEFKSQADNARALRQKGDTAAARAAFLKLRSDSQARIQPIRQQEQADIRNVLTPDQRAKFDAAQAQRKQWMEQHQKDGRSFGRGYNRGKAGQGS